MAKMFPEKNSKTLQEGLRRLIKSGLLVWACRGVYVNNNAKNLILETYQNEPWSEWEDLNLRPLSPEGSALSGWATLRMLFMLKV